MAAQGEEPPSTLRGWSSSYPSTHRITEWWKYTGHFCMVQLQKPKPWKVRYSNKGHRKIQWHSLYRNPGFPPPNYKAFITSNQSSNMSLKWLLSLFVFTSNMSTTGKTREFSSHSLHCHTKELGIKRRTRTENASLDSFSSIQPWTVYKCSQAFCPDPFHSTHFSLVFLSAGYSFN